MTETDDEIFVFGSNLAGRHGAGAAKYAKKMCAARYGIGRGRTGRSYAIPTKDKALKVLPLSTIEAYCFAFTEYARGNPSLRFYVTPIGTGHAGYSIEDIAPFFDDMPMNCRLAPTWNKGKQNA